MNSGTRYIHGMRTHYKEYSLSSLQEGTYQEFESKFFNYFKTTVTKNFTNQLQNYGKLSEVWPTSLLNAFTEGQA